MRAAAACRLRRRKGNESRGGRERERDVGRRTRQHPVLPVRGVLLDEPHNLRVPGPVREAQKLHRVRHAAEEERHDPALQLRVRGRGRLRGRGLPVRLLAGRGGGGGRGRREGLQPGEEGVALLLVSRRGAERGEVNQRRDSLVFRSSEADARERACVDSAARASSVAGLRLEKAAATLATAAAYSSEAVRVTVAGTEAKSRACGFS